jgi:D-alanine-D-alanine ligase
LTPIYERVICEDAGAIYAKARDKDSYMDDERSAKRSRRQRRPVEVAIVYNVDFDDARAADDPGFEARATVESVAREVAAALESDGTHNAALIPLGGDFAELKARLEESPPTCVFNMCETLGGDARLETAVPTVLDLLGIPYTGSNAQGLSAALYKDRVKERLIRAGIPTPQGVLIKRPGERCDLPFPLIVKPAQEDGSAGIWDRSVVHDKASLLARVDELISSFKAPCLVEQYIDGREFNVAILGYPQARVLPLQEISFARLPPGQQKIVSYDAKWRTGSVEDLGTEPIIRPDLTTAVATKLRRAATEAFRALGLRDYARVDVRLSSSAVPYVIDVNPNCDLSPDAGFARAAIAAGIDYAGLARLLVSYALSRRKTVSHARRAQPAPSGRAR